MQGASVLIHRVSADSSAFRACEFVDLVDCVEKTFIRRQRKKRGIGGRRGRAGKVEVAGRKVQPVQINPFALAVSVGPDIDEQFGDALLKSAPR